MSSNPLPPVWSSFQWKNICHDDDYSPRKRLQGPPSLPSSVWKASSARAKPKPTLTKLYWGFLVEKFFACDLLRR
jgi:hypothetical protein